jgi:PAS domain S-box-containing protein
MFGTELFNIINVEKPFYERLAGAIADNSFDAIVMIDSNSKILAWNRAAESLFGWTKDEALNNSAADLIIPKRYHSKHTMGMKNYLSTGKQNILERDMILTAVNKNGDEFAVQIRIKPINYKKKSMFIATVEDLSNAQKNARAEIERATELNARMKTTLSIVQAVAKQTLSGADPESVGSLISRLFSIEKTLNILYKDDWKSANLYNIVYDATYLYGSSKFIIKGDNQFNLSGNQAISFGLIIHELSTNSVKYGALNKNYKGVVNIEWRIKDGSLVWRWSESGGPLVKTPEDLGFGMQFVKRAFTGEGTTIVEYAKEGLTCTLVLKLPEDTLNV